LFIGEKNCLYLIKAVEGLYMYRKTLEAILARYPERTQNIILRRFNLSGQRRERTLEHIGREYGITRERIRQIIQQVFRDLNDSPEKKADVVVSDIELPIRKRGGIIEKERLFQELASDNENEYGAIEFFLEFSDVFSLFERDPRFTNVVATQQFDTKEFENIVEEAKIFLQKRKKPVTLGDILQEIPSEIDNQQRNKYETYLLVSPKFSNNPFGQWGLHNWSEVNPKGTREKAYLILKHNREPLHFRKIAQKIDEYGLGKKKKTNPQTVHNELIKDDNFVLVGRGVYALKDWGYQEGTVRQMIEKYLQERKSPMHKDDILSEILRSKKVKETTVLINLNSHFDRIGDGLYAIRSK